MPLFGVVVDVHGGGVPAQLTNILNKLEVLMAGVAEVNAAIEAQNGAIASLGAAQAHGFAEVAKDVQALKDKIAELEAAAAPDLQSIVDRLAANTAKIQESVDALNALDPVPTVDPAPGA